MDSWGLVNPWNLSKREVGVSNSWDCFHPRIGSLF
jgi:hypothetical protein